MKNITLLQPPTTYLFLILFIRHQELPQRFKKPLLLQNFRQLNLELFPFKI